MDLHIQVSASRIVLSFIISVFGALCAVSLNEMARVTADGLKKELVLLGVAFNIGGIAIWSMHFVGMSAWQLFASTPTGSLEVPIRFEVVITVISFLVCVLFVWIGVKIASKDRYFKEVLHAQKRTAITKDIAKTTSSLRQMRQSGFVLYFVLFKNLERVMIGGVITGTGVCVMHYVGMLAIRADAKIEWNAGFVALSVIIAVIAATAGLFIMFRILQFRPYPILHLISSIVIGIAVCGMHYTGMRAAEFVYEPGRSQWEAVTVSNNDLEGVTYAVFIVCGIFDFWVRTDLRRKQELIDNEINELKQSLQQMHYHNSFAKDAGGGGGGGGDRHAATSTKGNENSETHEGKHTRTSSRGRIALVGNQNTSSAPVTGAPGTGASTPRSMSAAVGAGNTQPDNGGNVFVHVSGQPPSQAPSGTSTPKSGPGTPKGAGAGGANVKIMPAYSEAEEIKEKNKSAEAFANIDEASALLQQIRLDIKSGDSDRSKSKSKTHEKPRRGTAEKDNAPQQHKRNRSNTEMARQPNGHTRGRSHGSGDDLNKVSSKDVSQPMVTTTADVNVGEGRRRSHSAALVEARRNSLLNTKIDERRDDSKHEDSETGSPEISRGSRVSSVVSISVDPDHQRENASDAISSGL